MPPPPPLPAPATARGPRRGVDFAHHLLRAGEQCLDDLSRTGAAEVAFLRHGRAEEASDHLGSLTEQCLGANFATAHLSVASEATFDTLEGVVRALGRVLRTPGAPRARSGLAAMLAAFAQAHGRHALERFDEGAREFTLRGELATLARDFLSTPTPRRAESARIDAWLSGVELARATQDDSAVPALSARTAKRALADITRLVRALGHRGTLITIAGAEVVPKLPPARREASYTVLRELIDNADGGHGMVATRMVVAASTSFFQGARSLASLPPLLTRLESVRDAPPGVAPPHRPVIDLGAPEAWQRRALQPVRSVDASALSELRAVIRASHGLAPLEPEVALSVGVDRIDRTVDTLFEHTDIDGSVFALVVGEYGAGKTHFLLHLAARALAEARPVLRLSLERLDADLGHPERHLSRMLESALVPPRGAGYALDALARWTSTPENVARLRAALVEIAHAGDEAGASAERALAWAANAPRPGAALEAYLRAGDLLARRPSPRARADAYARLLVWLALLSRLEGAAGPVLLIDEAENLYRAGLSRAERRTALRSLSFYCGGVMPRACVVLAVTPDALAALREEAPTLLSDVAEQRTVLDSEDATMLCRRLTASRPINVPQLSREERATLLARVASAHARARGPVDPARLRPFIAQLANEPGTPRELLRRAIDFLERSWWEPPLV